MLRWLVLCRLSEYKNNIHDLMQCEWHRCSLISNETGTNINDQMADNIPGVPAMASPLLLG